MRKLFRCTITKKVVLGAVKENIVEIDVIKYPLINSDRHMIEDLHGYRYRRVITPQNFTVYTYERIQHVLFI